MAGYDGAGSLFALGMRVTKLGPTGAPLVGLNNSYVTNALVQVELGLNYNTPDAVTQLNGSGVVCTSYQAPATVESGLVNALRVCQVDPNLVSFLIGGRVYEDIAVPANQIGYGAPETGTTPVPNGVSLEFWSQAIVGSAQAASLPYWHWVVPRADLQAAGNLALNATAAVLPEFSGTARQNAAWGDGPVGDFDYASDRVWQGVRIATLPDLTRGFREVLADV